MSRKETTRADRFKTVILLMAVNRPAKLTLYRRPKLTPLALIGVRRGF